MITSGAPTQRPPRADIALAILYGTPGNTAGNTWGAGYNSGDNTHISIAGHAYLATQLPALSTWQ